MPAAALSVQSQGRGVREFVIDRRSERREKRHEVQMSERRFALSSAAHHRDRSSSLLVAVTQPQNSLTTRQVLYCAPW